MKRFNWQIWAGFVLTFAGLISYPLFFVKFPVTRDFPWANLVLIVIALILLAIGVRRAFGPESRLRSKVVGSVLALVSIAAMGLFVFGIFVLARQLPGSSGAPRVSQRAPDFSLVDTTGRTVTLAELLSSQVKGKATKGVLLVFYRGYW